MLSTKIKKMEPLTTTKMITGIVNYLGLQLSKNRSINEFISDFSDATINWIRPLFIQENGEEKEALKQLREKPKSIARQNLIKTILEVELENNPEEVKVKIKEIFSKITKVEEKIINRVLNSKNVNTGNINSNGGNVQIGDNQKTTN